MTIPTDAQSKTRARNWKIRCLRGYWYNLQHISSERMDRIRAIIDEELLEAGAEPETLRSSRRQKFWDNCVSLSNEEYSKQWNQVKKPWGGKKP